jgi:hypothetical protein
VTFFPTSDECRSIAKLVRSKEISELVRALSNDAAILTWLENQPMYVSGLCRIAGQAADLDLLKIGWLHLAAQL